jgi:hypothetical protein
VKAGNAICNFDKNMLVLHFGRLKNSSGHRAAATTYICF